MKKRIAFRKLSRTSSHRWSMFRNMVSSLIDHERIVTTEAKAKELRPIAEKMITLAKKQDLHNLRRAAAVVRGDTTLNKLFEVMGPRYEHREGGYTRIMKLAKPRKGDNAPMAVIEYVDRPGEIRAARPPGKFQHQAMSSIESALRDMGIPPIEELVSEEEREEIAKELLALEGKQP
jgi:large subunit ribosomal protein L17